MPIPDFWRVEVKNENDGGSKQMLGLNDEIARIGPLTRTGYGDCLEGELVGLTSQLNISPRDIIFIEKTDDAGTTWDPVWRGIVLEQPNSRSTRVGTIKMEGMRRRLYETPLDIIKIDGADVGAMVRQALKDQVLPYGVFYDSNFVPDQTFTLGDRVPRFESIGEFLDFMMSTVSGFTAGAGGYTHDGVTYNENDAVPRTEWGVRADGRLYFRRDNSSGSKTEGTANKIAVRWPDVSAEDKINDVIFVFGVDAVVDGVTGASIKYLPVNIVTDPNPPFVLLPYEPVPVFRRKKASTNDPARINLTKFLTPVLEFTDLPLGGQTVDTSANINNAANAIDGDDATAAVTNGAIGQATFDLNLAQVAGEHNIVRLVYSIDSSLASAFLSSPTDEVVLGLEHRNADEFRRFLYRIRLPETGGDITEVIAVLPTDASMSSIGVNTTRVFVDGFREDTAAADTGSVNIYELELLRLNDTGGEIIDRAFEAFFRTTEVNPAQVMEQDAVGDPVASLQVTTLDFGSITLPVESMTTVFSPDEGVATAYRLGQKFKDQSITFNEVINRKDRGTERDAIRFSRGSLFR